MPPNRSPRDKGDTERPTLHRYQRMAKLINSPHPNARCRHHSVLLSCLFAFAGLLSSTGTQAADYLSTDLRARVEQSKNDTAASLCNIGMTNS
jgi:hypothetical protein